MARVKKGAKARPKRGASTSKRGASTSKRAATTRTSKRGATFDIVYVGPTLAASEVVRLLPNSSVRGPVAIGDVLRAIDEPGVRRIAIIDGYFERMAAVWHKEILLAIEAGIEVWGAASMGALRAAELAPFGMRGVGAIYERFASGELEADDEVAVAHLPAEFGYRTTSVALVDLRDGIERTTTAPIDRDGVERTTTAPIDRCVTPDNERATDDLVTLREKLVELARVPFYRDRSWERLCADAKAAGIPARVVVALASPPPSRKTADAILLLTTMHDTAPTPRVTVASQPAMRVPRTWALGQLRAWLAKQSPLAGRPRGRIARI